MRQWDVMECDSKMCYAEKVGGLTHELMHDVL